MLKVFYTKIAKRTGKFVNYQEHIGEGLVLEIREQDPKVRNWNLEIERRKLGIEKRKVAKQMQLAFKVLSITSWVGGIIISVIAILHAYPPR